MNATCVDLKTAFPGYRPGWDPSREGGERDPWMRVLLCRFGEIFPYGRTRLAASVDGHPGIAAKMRRLACVTVIQDGCDGLTAVFDVADFAAVAEITRPRKKRQVSPEQKAALLARLSGQSKAEEATPGAQGGVRTPQADPRDA